MTRQIATMLFIISASLQVPGPAFAQTEVENHRITPDAGVRTSVRANSVMWTDHRAIVSEGATVSTTVRKQGFMAAWEIPAYTPLTQASSKSAFKACAPDNGPCLLDDDGDCQFDRIAQDDVSMASKLGTKATYERLRVIKPGTEVIRTITYLGRSNGKIQLQYAERGRDYTPIAEEFRAYLPTVTTVTIRDITIHIFGADDSKIEFEASSQLASPASSAASCLAK